MAESAVECLVSELKALSLQDRAEVKSLLDELVREDRKDLFHTPYHQTIHELTKVAPEYATDITLLDGKLSEN